MARRGKTILCVTERGEPLSFEVKLGGQIFHTKLAGMGFISNKEKVIACAVKIVKALGGDGKIIKHALTEQEPMLEQDTIPEDGVCKRK